MTNSSQSYSCSTGQAGGGCKHPECSLRCSQAFGALLAPCPESWWQLPLHCEQVWWVLCHCTTEDFASCIVLPVPALQGALLCSEYIYSLERSRKNATSQIFFLWLLSIFLHPLCFQIHMCWSNVQSCLGITLPLSPLVHRFLLPWSSCSCCCLAS